MRGILKLPPPPGTFQGISYRKKKPTSLSFTFFQYLDSLLEMGRNLVVFDFDWSFVDQDTDRWVFEVLSTKLRRTLQTRKSGGSQCTPDVV